MKYERRIKIEEEYIRQNMRYAQATPTGVSNFLVVNSN